MRVSINIVLAGLLAITTACASTAPTESLELARLRDQNLELRRDAAMARVELDRLEKRLKELETEQRRSVEPANPSPPAPADPGVQSPRPPERQPPVEEVDLVEEPLIGLSSPSPRDEQQLYDGAYSLFHEQRYEQAAARFLEFVELFPTSELADNAQFWIGECYYARGDYEKALAAFSETVERYPNGNKVADSLLKAGRCLAGLGDETRAHATYKEVRNRFPGTGAAASAAELLRER